MNDNLNNHKIINTWYMTDEQIKNAKKIDKENGVSKNVGKFFLATAATLLAFPVGAITAAVIGQPILSALAAGAIIGTPAIYGMKTFFKLFKGGEKIREELYDKDPNEKSGKTK